MTQIDWATALEDGIDDGPALRPPSDAVAAGRRALRRRRRRQGAAGGVVLALATTVGVGTSLLADQDPGVDFASSRSTQHRAVPASTDLPVYRGRGGCGVAVCFDEQGRLVRASADVRVDAVYTDVVSTDGSAFWDRTAAVSATRDGETTWELLRWVPDQVSGSAGPARHDMDFDEWVSRLHDEPWLATGGERP